MCGYKYINIELKQAGIRQGPCAGVGVIYHCYYVTILQCYVVTMLQYCNVYNVTMQYYNVSVLQCSNVPESGACLQDAHRTV